MKMRDMIATLGSVVLVVGSAGATSLALRRFVSTSSAPPPSIQQPADVKYLGATAHSISSGRLLAGSHETSPRLLEFADFQCPFCRISALLLDSLLQNEKHVTIEYHHLPLTAHLYAREAALAADCADEQGAFRRFYDVTFTNQRQIGNWSWHRFAELASVSDLRAFDRCLTTRRYSARVDSDVVLSRTLGITGTPAWIVGDSLFTGAPTRAQLEEWLRRTED